MWKYLVPRLLTDPLLVVNAQTYLNVYVVYVVTVVENNKNIL